MIRAELLQWLADDLKVGNITLTATGQLQRGNVVFGIVRSFKNSHTFETHKDPAGLRDTLHSFLAKIHHGPPAIAHEALLALSKRRLNQNEIRQVYKLIVPDTSCKAALALVKKGLSPEEISLVTS